MSERKFQPINTCDGARLNAAGEFVSDGSLSVRITANCHSACDFCIAAEDMKIKYKFDMAELVRKTKESGTDTLSLIGGEPLLFLDKCDDYLEAVLGECDIKNVYITSALPNTIVKRWDKFLKVMEKTDYMTVSIQGVTDGVNNDLLRTKQRFSRMDLLKKILETPELNEKIIVNLNLVKGGVDTKGKFFAALFTLESWGVKHLRINELMHSPKNYVNFEDMLGVDLGAPYSGGCKTSLNLSDKMEIILKRSCFMVEESLSPNDEDLEKIEDKIAHPELYQTPGYRILYENGEFDHKWRKTRLDV